MEVPSSASSSRESEDLVSSSSNGESVDDTRVEVEPKKSEGIKAEDVVVGSESTSGTTTAVNIESPPPLVVERSSEEGTSSSGSGNSTSGSGSGHVEQTEDEEQLAAAEQTVGDDLEAFSFQLKLDLNNDHHEHEHRSGPEENPAVPPPEDDDCDDEDDDEDQWDFSLKKLKQLGPEYKTIWVSDKQFIKALTKMNAFGGCDHEPIKINCPCEKQTKFSVCFRCHLVFCSAKCARIHKIKQKNKEDKDLQKPTEKTQPSVASNETKSLLTEDDNLSTVTGSSIEANRGSAGDEDERAVVTSPAAQMANAQAQPADLNAQSVVETKQSKKQVGRKDAKQNFSPKSKEVASGSPKKSYFEENYTYPPKEPFEVRDRRLTEKVMEMKRLEEEQAALLGFSLKPNPQGRGLLPYPVDVFNDKSWPCTPVPMMPGVQQWGPIPVMMPHPLMNGNMRPPRLGSPPQPSPNGSFNQFRAPGSYNIRRMQTDRNRNERYVERNPRSVRQEFPQGLQGARPGIMGPYRNENPAVNNTLNPSNTEDSRDDVDEDLRFHERHTSHEPDAGHVRRGNDNISQDRQVSPSKRGGRNNSRVPVGPPCGQSQHNQAERNQRNFRDQDRRSGRGDEPSSQPSAFVSSKSSNSNEPQGNGDRLLKMVQSGKSSFDQLSRSKSSDSSRLRTPLLSNNEELSKCDTLSSSSRNDSSSVVSNKSRNDPESNSNANVRQPVGYRSLPEPQESSPNSRMPMSSTSRQPLPESGNHPPRGKHFWSSKKISQRRDFLFDIPIMVGHSFGVNIYDFFAFDAGGGLERLKIEKAISLIEKFTPLTSFTKDSYCLAKYAADECWYRARVLEKVSDEKARVFFIDYGNQEVVDSQFLCEIPESLHDFHTSVINISNVDFKPNINREAELVLERYFEEYLSDKWFRVTILMEDIAMGSRTTGYPMYKVKLEIHIENLWINYAVLLEREDIGKQTFKNPKLNRAPRFNSSEQVVLDKSTELPILISNVNSLNDFDAIQIKHTEMRDEISKELETLCDEKPVYPMDKWAESEFICAAKRKGRQWARAKILMIGKDANTVEVKFVDYGDTASVSTRNLKSLPSEMLRIPQLAFKCSLPVFPVDGTWDNEWIELFKTVADSGLGGKTAVYLYSKEVDPHVIYIVEVFTGNVKDGLAKTVLQRCPADYECAYDVNLDVRHRRV